MTKNTLESYLLIDESRRHEKSGIKGPDCVEMTCGEVLDVICGASRAEFAVEKSTEEIDALEDKIDRLKGDNSRMESDLDDAIRARDDAVSDLEKLKSEIATKS